MKNTGFIQNRTYPHIVIDNETERVMIAERAYFKSKKRNFESGRELDDWLEAEQEILNQSFYWRIG